MEWTEEGKRIERNTAVTKASIHVGHRMSESPDDGRHAWFQLSTPDSLGIRFWLFLG